MKRQLLNIEETAKIIGLAPKTIRNSLGPKAKVKFPIQPRRIGSRVFFDSQDVEAFIDSLSAEPTEI